MLFAGALGVDIPATAAAMPPPEAAPAPGWVAGEDEPPTMNDGNGSQGGSGRPHEEQGAALASALLVWHDGQHHRCVLASRG